MIISEIDFLQNVIINRLTGVTGQSIPPAELYPGLKRPRLDYTGNIMA